jgi:hypothetical protein
MSVDPNVQVSNEQEIAQKANDKEMNFRKQEVMYEKMLEKERQEKMELQKRLEERSKPQNDDDDDDDEPYVDRRKLEKKLNKFGQQTKQETENIVQQEVRKALEEERKINWMRNNPDFYEVMQHADKLASRDPELAETILTMPDNFERQKLVYKNIKALGVHKKEEPKVSIQETIDKNRRTPYYQPSGIGAPPYGIVSGGKDYSPSEQKNAFDKMRELQSKLRL